MECSITWKICWRDCRGNNDELTRGTAQVVKDGNTYVRMECRPCVTRTGLKLQLRHDGYTTIAGFLCPTGRVLNDGESISSTENRSLPRKLNGVASARRLVPAALKLTTLTPPCFVCRLSFPLNLPLKTHSVPVLLCLFHGASASSLEWLCVISSPSRHLRRS